VLFLNTAHFSADLIRGNYPIAGELYPSTFRELSLARVVIDRHPRRLTRMANSRRDYTLQNVAIVRKDDERDSRTHPRLAAKEKRGSVARANCQSFFFFGGTKLKKRNQPLQ